MGGVSYKRQKNEHSRNLLKCFYIFLLCNTSVIFSKRQLCYMDQECYGQGLGSFNNTLENIHCVLRSILVSWVNKDFLSLSKKKKKGMQS